MHCRSCNTPLTHVFVDLGEMPSANNYLRQDQLSEPEPRYPLKVFVCEECFLVQIPEFHNADSIFTTDYAYFSSYATGWVDHARRYSEMIADRFNLNEESFVIEIASNDGYLLKNFVEAKIPCLGIDPAADAARAARAVGVETVIDFFSSRLATQLKNKNRGADLIAGNNVLAHVPDVNDFVEGVKTLLNPGGVVTMEFPHLVRLVESVQFDTIYDEHFSYFSFHAVCQIFERQKLVVFDVEELGTHGGSLRLYARHAEDEQLAVSNAVSDLINHEKSLGVLEMDYYLGFQEKVRSIREQFLSFVADEKALGRRFAAFGAAAKGNIFLNYCGIGPEIVEFVVDDTPAKQNKFLPGSHIPVVGEERLRAEKPDIIVILPWNLKDEIMRRLDFVSEWGGRFVIGIPKTVVC